MFNCEPEIDPRYADCCDDERLIISPIGRGPKGDSTQVRMEDSEFENATYLTGMEFNDETQAWEDSWKTGNINGGRLFCDVIYHDDTTPTTFQLKFRYSRPDRTEWTVLTPLIEYTGGHPEPGAWPITIDELAVALGLTHTQMVNVLDGVPEQLVSPVYPDIKGDNIKDYIDKLTDAIGLEEGDYIKIEDGKISVTNFATFEDIDNIFV